jgi:hypothetical protein
MRRRRRRDDDFAREIHAHLELEAARLIDEGLDPGRLAPRRSDASAVLRARPNTSTNRGADAC